MRSNEVVGAYSKGSTAGTHPVVLVILVFLLRSLRLISDMWGRQGEIASATSRRDVASATIRCS